MRGWQSIDIGIGVAVGIVIAAMTIPDPLSQREPPPLQQQNLQQQVLQQQVLQQQSPTQNSPETATTGSIPQTAATASIPEIAAPVSIPEKEEARLEEDDSPDADHAAGAAEGVAAKPDLNYLADYAYSEVPPDTKPADTILQSIKDVPAGTPVEEVKRAADAFGLNASFMVAVAKIESDFDPTQRTGSYIGLFQLSHYEFDRFGSGEITDSRDNAIAAAYKFTTAAILFELDTHKKPTLSDLYLIHQQGWQGAAEHVSHPKWIAWKSMCATDEGREKGEKWCKRAVWANTLPDIKHVWKSVDNLTSAAFVEMWRQRVALFYARYSQTLTDK